ncbi:unnamed protein product [marine sediment metagenome]|uniref:Uncharacterized protein n=1 Tax=marine sediment metagenome TaxID=412755 RepID=X1CWK1_9ZZZZ
MCGIRLKIKSKADAYDEIHENKLRLMMILDKENEVGLSQFTKHLLMKMCADYDYILDKIER